MSKIYVPSRGAADWRLLLAEPERQWRSGYSAKELAECWEAAAGFPAEVAGPLGSGFPGIRPLIIIPELKVHLPGGQRASQNDLWVLARSGAELLSITVEGKVEESFDRPIEEWLVDASHGKQARWSYLKEKLGLDEEPDGSLRYQLFHRTVSAIIQAEEFNAGAAVMIVHSFSAAASWFEDYAAFLKLFGVDAAKGKLQQSVRSAALPLHFLWATGTLRTQATASAL